MSVAGDCHVTPAELVCGALEYRASATPVDECDRASAGADDDSESRSVAGSDSHSAVWLAGGAGGATRRGSRSGGAGAAAAHTTPVNKCVSIGMLMRSGLLVPGDGVMAVEYMGQTFRGDLLVDGQIRSHETAEVFGSPSSWAAHCQKIVNPDKRSGCGWSSVRYRDKKLEHYKNLYFRRRRELAQEHQQEEDEQELEEEESTETAAGHEGGGVKSERGQQQLIQKIIVKHEMLSGRVAELDPCTLVECVPFAEVQKIQPFLVSVTSTALAVLGLHCHLVDGEVVGYLAGKWDVNCHQVSITHAFPCRVPGADRCRSKRVEFEVFAAIHERNLTLVGWYHSHPHSPPTPTVRDCEQQLEHELRLKGASDCSYTPCVGLIYAPFPHYHQQQQQQQQTLPPPPARAIQHNLLCFWSMPPPEARPADCPRPFAMEYTINRDSFIHSDALKQMSLCVEHYHDAPDAVSFTRPLPDGSTHWQKLHTALESCSATSPASPHLIDYLRSLLLPPSSPPPPPPPLPSATTTTAAAVAQKPEMDTDDAAAALVAVASQCQSGTGTVGDSVPVNTERSSAAGEQTVSVNSAGGVTVAAGGAAAAAGAAGVSLPVCAEPVAVKAEHCVDNTQLGDRSAATAPTEYISSGQSVSVNCERSNVPGTVGSANGELRDGTAADEMLDTAGHNDDTQMECQQQEMSEQPLSLPVSSSGNLSAVDVLVSRTVPARSPFNCVSMSADQQQQQTSAHVVSAGVPDESPLSVALPLTTESPAKPTLTLTPKSTESAIPLTSNLPGTGGSLTSTVHRPLPLNIDEFGCSVTGVLSDDDEQSDSRMVIDETCT